MNMLGRIYLSFLIIQLDWFLIKTKLILIETLILIFAEISTLLSSYHGMRWFSMIIHSYHSQSTLKVKIYEQ